MVFAQPWSVLGSSDRATAGARPLLDIALSMATSALADAGMRLRIYTTLEQGFKEMNVRVLPPLNQSEL